MADWAGGDQDRPVGEFAPYRQSDNSVVLLAVVIGGEGIYPLGEVAANGGRRRWLVMLRGSSSRCGLRREGIRLG